MASFSLSLTLSLSVSLSLSLSLSFYLSLSLSFYLSLSLSMAKVASEQYIYCKYAPNTSKSVPQPTDSFPTLCPAQSAPSATHGHHPGSSYSSSPFHLCIKKAVDQWKHASKDPPTYYMRNSLTSCVGWTKAPPNMWFCQINRASSCHRVFGGISEAKQMPRPGSLQFF